VRASDDQTIAASGVDVTDDNRLDSIPEAPADFDDAATVGAYTVLHRIGQGGMGTVFAAYDLQLDRKIALKVLHPSRQGKNRLRVLREAQALAKLSHPHVVAVYATGEHAGRLYIAMEFVDGLELNKWRKEKRPDTEAILDAYRQAGRGLAAAHAAGLIHRDFKPHNAMIDAQGHVKVLDFGLARRAGRDEGTSDEGGSQPSTDVLSSNDLTRTGSAVGTPAYMAPEQMMGVKTDARTDQFSFCVSLWEALFDTRPFQGATLAELMLDATTSKPRIPEDPGEAGWTVPVLRRGLASDPDDRWPDMEALLTALQPKEPQSRRTVWLVAAGITAVGAGVAWQMAAKDPVEVCTDGEHIFARTWNDARRDRVRSALLASDRTYAESVAARAIEALDTFAEQWVDARQSACVDARDGGQSDTLRDARYTCLERSKQAFGLLAQALEDGGGEVLDQSNEAVASLPVLDRCADVDYVTASVPPPASPEVARKVETLRERLQQAATLRVLGNHEAAETEVSALEKEVADIDYPPIRAAVHLEAARVALDTQDGLLALNRTEAAYLEAHHLDPATIIDIHLTLSRAYEVRELHEPASRELRVARGLIDRWMPSDQALQLRVLKATGLNAGAVGDVLVSRDAHRQALELAIELEGPRSARAAEAHLHVSAAELDVGNGQSGLKHATAAYEIWSALYGPQHPDVARALNNTASANRVLGNSETALKTQERAIAIFEAAYGEDSTNTLMTRLNLALGCIVMGELDRAEGEIRETLTLLERTPTERLRLQASAHKSLGIIAVQRGDAAVARRALGRALDLNQEIFGPRSPTRGDVLGHLAVLEANEGNLEVALDYHRETLQLYRAVEPQTPSDIADAESNVGLILAGLGQCEQAWPLLKSGLEYWTPRMTPENYFAGWFVAQNTIAAMCAELLGKEEAKMYAKRARDMRLSNVPETAQGAKRLAELILEERTSTERKQVADAVRDELTPPLARLLDHWLEASQAAASRSRK
jgi:tetratricopeptide (TPR) repeat protein/predicted Ser/Thr protein kinase